MTNDEWLQEKSARGELTAWLNAEHAETANGTLDGDTAALEAKIDELTAERDKLQEQLLVGWECERRLQAERDYWKEQVHKILACAPGSFAQGVMFYPRPDNLIEPSSLVTDEIHSLRDFLAESEKERELYRTRLSAAIDNAARTMELMD